MYELDEDIDLQPRFQLSLFRRNLGIVVCLLAIVINLGRTLVFLYPLSDEYNWDISNWTNRVMVALNFILFLELYRYFRFLSFKTIAYATLAAYFSNVLLATTSLILDLGGLELLTLFLQCRSTFYIGLFSLVYHGGIFTEESGSLAFNHKNHCRN